MLYKGSVCSLPKHIATHDELHKEDINKVKSAHSDYVFNTIGHVVEKDNYPVSKNVSFTVEDCELAYVKQEHYRVSLQNETTTFEELK